MGGPDRNRVSEDFDFVMGILLISIAVIVGLVLLQSQIGALFGI